MNHFILASASPRRSDILSQIGISFEVVKSLCNEDLDGTPTPKEAVKILSERKAKDVLSSDTVSEISKTLTSDINSDDKLIIISADTVVALDNKIIGKPANKTEAFNTLKSLSGKKHSVFTGMTVAIKNLNKSFNETKFITVSSESYVYFKNLSDEEILSYINTEEPMDKAGSYAIQGIGSLFIDRLEGDYFTVVGLPVSLLYDILKQNNINIL